MSTRADDVDPETRARLFELTGVPEPEPPKRSADKEAELLFGRQILQYHLPVFKHGYRFPKSAYPENKRKVWIADYCSIEFKIMVEIDGGIWVGDGHGHPTGITKGMLKLNDAALLGYHMLRFSTSWVKPRHAINFLQRVLFTKGWRPS